MSDEKDKKKSLGSSLVTRLVLFLVRRRLKLKKYQKFRFANQRFKNDTYYFTPYRLVHYKYNEVQKSYRKCTANVGLNYLLGNRCQIQKMNITE